MPVEVEMKAWVHDFEDTRRRIEQECGHGQEILKHDRYFRAPVAVGGTHREFRLRMVDGFQAVCTFKSKRMDDYVEISKEVEFGVSDPKAFVELVVAIGCRQFAAKRKQGWYWHWQRLTVELVEVAGVGRFLEVERLLDDEQAQSDTLVAQTAEELRRFFRLMQIDKRHFESRRYLELLPGEALQTPLF